jgi:hypothetical protein
MSVYSKLARWLLATSIAVLVVTEPCANAMQSAANRPLATQSTEQVAVKKAVQQTMGQSPQFTIRKVAVVSDYALVTWLQGRLAE